MLLYCSTFELVSRRRRHYSTGIYRIAKQSTRANGNFPLHAVFLTNSQLVYLAPAVDHKVYPALPPSIYLSASYFCTASDSALSQIFLWVDADSPSRAFSPTRRPKNMSPSSRRVSIQVASCDTNDDVRHSRPRLHKKYRGNCITWKISLFFSEQTHVPHPHTKNK